MNNMNSKVIKRGYALELVKQRAMDLTDAIEQLLNTTDGLKSVGSAWVLLRQAQQGAANAVSVAESLQRGESCWFVEPEREGSTGERT